MTSGGPESWRTGVTAHAVGGAGDVEVIEVEVRAAVPTISAAIVSTTGTRMLPPAVGEPDTEGRGPGWLVIGRTSAFCCWRRRASVGRVEGRVVHPLQAVAVAVAGVLAGMINTVVGSGTLITFPVLLAVGYPPLTANVSNGLGLVPGSLFGAIGYRKELTGQGPRVRKLGVVSTVGAVIGAVLLLVLPADAFNAVVPVLIGIALVLVVVQPWLARKLAARRAATAAAAEAQGEQSVQQDSWLMWVGILATGVYGGYFGAAQGVLLLGLMGILLAESLQRINAIKNVLAMLANLASGIVFVFIAHVAWLVVLLIAIGSAIGGVLGARVGRALPPVVLRGLIVVIGLAAMAKLLFFS
jgi:uncharacterized membrane protein YfcA